MAKLRKYQVKAIRSEVISRLNEEKEQIQDSSEYQTKQEEIAADLVGQCQFGEYQHLKQRKEQLQQELQEVKDKKKAIAKEAEDILNCKIRYGGSMTDAINKESEKRALEEMNFNMPSSGKVENAIIVADLDGADDIIEAVIEKLENNG